VENYHISGPELATLWWTTGNFLVLNWQLSGGELATFCWVLEIVDRPLDSWRKYRGNEQREARSEKREARREK